MKLFIANATKHIQQFAYRIPEFPRVFQNEIRPGEQIVVYQDTDKATLEHIIAQHQDCPKPFLIPVEELDRHRGFVGLIFSFEKPVPAFKIEDTFKRNDEALEALGKEQRKEAAVALNATMEHTAREVGASVSAVEMSVQEEGRKDDPSGTTKVNETVEVSKDGKGRRGR